MIAGILAALAIAAIVGLYAHSKIEEYKAEMEEEE